MIEAWDAVDLDQSCTIGDEFSEYIGKNRQWILLVDLKSGINPNGLALGTERIPITKMGKIMRNFGWVMGWN